MREHESQVTNLRQFIMEHCNAAVIIFYYTTKETSKPLSLVSASRCLLVPVWHVDSAGVSLFPVRLEETFSQTKRKIQQSPPKEQDQV
jgi:hypothetical protein